MGKPALNRRKFLSIATGGAAALVAGAQEASAQFIKDTLSIDDPRQDYLWSLASPLSINESVWKLRDLVPEPDKARLIRTAVYVTPTPPPPTENNPRTVGLAYCGFRDEHGSMINHVVSCWSTEIHRYGAEPFTIRSKPDTGGSKEFRLESNDFFSRMEYCEGGFTLRLEHSDWRQYCLPYWGAWDSICPGGYHTQANLGMFMQPVNTSSQSETEVSRVDLGQVRALRKIAQRLVVNLGEGSTVKMFWSEDGCDFHEFFSRTGPRVDLDYAGLQPESPINVRYIHVKLSSPLGNAAGAALYKLFCWG
ncbi:MAG: hypothetical protein HY315_09130 [Acidobacteria bacterium]|nr:hypothetical protein [Acidobacteriota bacterium]